MSFTEGQTFQINTGSAIDALDNKVGSFVIFIWPDSSTGPSATFAVSKNDFGIDWKRLSCVRDGNGLYIVPKVVSDGSLYITLSADTTDYPTFNVKIIG